MKKINVDYYRNNNLTDFAKAVMREQFCLPGEDFQDSFSRAAFAFSGGDILLAQRLYDYVSKQWFSFSTPLLSNGGTKKGLPISCFLNYVNDSIQGLCENFHENAYLSVMGGGIGTYWGHVRSIGETSSKGVATPGVIPFMHVQDAQMLAYHQGDTRRGAAAAYLDISHPEIFDFIEMRSSTGGDPHRKNENMHHGVCIPDSFMYAVREGLTWDLIDPHSHKVHQTVQARDLWIKLLEQRVKLGEPYLFFVDTANRLLPKTQKEKGLYIHHSNLCCEITLPTNKDRTAVCCLSSINIAKIDEWSHVQDQFIDDLVTMLDNALDVFCENAPDSLWRAIDSVKKERSIGLGTLGLHTFLQMNGIPLSSEEAQQINKQIFKSIQDSAKKASRRLASVRGEPEDMFGTGLRNAHLIAIAPNATSSIIAGSVSPSIEPLAGNFFTHKTKTGSHEVKNPALVEFLTRIGKNTEEVWKSIALNLGSVQHLNFLSKQEKDVFKTALEIDAQTMVDLAADRQKYICQAQSVNLFFNSNANVKELHNTHFSAWEKGLKSLYYLRSTSVKATSVGVYPDIISDKPTSSCVLGQDCKSCEG